MNKRVNQLINQLHLDPKKEAAVRKIVENAVSNNSGGGSGPVIIELPFGEEEIEAVSLSEEQINAAKNGNIKLKMKMPNDIYLTFVPYMYVYIKKDEDIVFYVRSMDSAGHIADEAYSINVIDKTITL